MNKGVSHKRRTRSIRSILDLDESRRIWIMQCSRAVALRNSADTQSFEAVQPHQLTASELFFLLLHEPELELATGSARHRWVGERRRTVSLQVYRCCSIDSRGCAGRGGGETGRLHAAGCRAAPPAELRSACGRRLLYGRPLARRGRQRRNGGRGRHGACT